MRIINHGLTNNTSFDIIKKINFWKVILVFSFWVKAQNSMLSNQEKPKFLCFRAKEIPKFDVFKLWEAKYSKFSCSEMPKSTFLSYEKPKIPSFQAWKKPIIVSSSAGTNKNCTFSSFEKPEILCIKVGKSQKLYVFKLGKAKNSKFSTMEKTKNSTCSS